MARSHEESVTVEISSTIIGQADTLVEDFTGTGTAAQGGSNVIRRMSGGLFSSTITADPLLGPLQNNGGPTPTMALVGSSPAIDKGISFNSASTDQRGVPRNVFRVDIGAYERTSIHLVVNTTADEAVDTDDHTLSLREAINLINGTLSLSSLSAAELAQVAAADTELISFAGSLNGGTITLSTVGDVSVGPSALLVSSAIAIESPGGDSGVTLSAAGTTMRLFHVASTGSLTLKNLTLTGGNAQGFAGGNANLGGPGGGGAGLGGAIFNQGALKIIDSTLTGNTARGGAGGSVDGALSGLGGAGGAGLSADGGTSPNYVPGHGLSNNWGGRGGGPNAGFPGGVISSDPDPAGRFVNGKNGGFGGGATGGGYNSVPGSGGYGGGRGGFNGTLDNDRRAAGGGGAGMGGAVFNEAGTVVITNSIITGNTAVGGAGGSAFYSFQIGEAGKGLGGGLFNHNGTITVTDSDFSGNTAARSAALGSLSDSYGNTTASVTAAAYITNTILGHPQTISFDLLADMTYGDGDFAISASSSSGLPVSFTASGDASVLLIGDVWYVHIIGAGIATITAHQLGDANYDPAQDVSRDLIIAKASSVTTTIGDGPFIYDGEAHAGGSGTATGARLDVGATSLTYSANSDGTGVADLTNAGVYYVTAHYAGDDNHTASDGEAVAVVIGKATAAITVISYSTTYDGNAHTAAGTATGVGGVDLSGSLNLGGTTHTNAGAYKGDAWSFHDLSGNYEDAAGAVHNSIARADQTIAFGPLGTATFGGGPIQLASASTSGLPVVFSIVSGPGMIRGGSLVLLGAGTIVVQASQAGDANHHAAVAVQRALVVNKAVATIVVNPYAVTYDGQAHAATGTVTGVGGVDLGGGLSLAGTVHVNAGAYDGDTWTFHDPSGNYEDAAGTVANRIARASQSITFGPLRPVTLGAGPITLIAASSSGLPVTYSIVSGPGEIHGTTLSVSGAGVVVVQASQAGDGNYNPASVVQQTQVVWSTAEAPPQVVAFRVLYGNGKSYDLASNSRAILPWRITGVEVVFSKNVFGNRASLARRNPALRLGGFRGNGSDTLRWTFARAVESADIMVQLASTGNNRIRDAAGGGLDGDGNGVASDAYSRNFKLLYGDYNGDGSVTTSDAVAIRNLVGKTNVFADLNGDGKVNLADVQIPLRRRNIRDAILNLSRNWRMMNRGGAHIPRAIA